MNQLTTFNFESNQVRTVTHNDEPWFVGKDVAEILGYADTDYAIRTHCKKAMTIPEEISGIDFRSKIIPESDVYRLIIKSKKPEAAIFETWVMEEVLPQIRKTGSYGMPTTTGNPLLDALIVTQQQVTQNAQKTKEIEEKQTQQGDLLNDMQEQLRIMEAKTTLVNQVEKGYVPTKTAHAKYGAMLSYEAFKLFLDAYQVKSKPYMYYLDDGYNMAKSRQYVTMEVIKMVTDILLESTQVTKHYYTHPKFLGRFIIKA